jgi:hypothetical protein
MPCWCGIEAFNAPNPSHPKLDFAFSRSSCIASTRLTWCTLNVQDLDEPEFGHFFVKKTITLALDMHNREREMASALLAAMYTHVRHL